MFAQIRKGKDISEPKSPVLRLAKLHTCYKGDDLLRYKLPEKPIPWKYGIHVARGEEQSTKAVASNVDNIMGD